MTMKDTILPIMVAIVAASLCGCTGSDPDAFLSEPPIYIHTKCRMLSRLYEIGAGIAKPEKGDFVDQGGFELLLPLRRINQPHKYRNTLRSYFVTADGAQYLLAWQCSYRADVGVLSMRPLLSVFQHAPSFAPGEPHRADPHCAPGFEISDIRGWREMGGPSAYGSGRFHDDRVDRNAKKHYAYDWYLTIESLGTVGTNDMTSTYNNLVKWNGKTLAKTDTIGIGDCRLVGQSVASPR